MAVGLRRGIRNYSVSFMLSPAIVHVEVHKCIDSKDAAMKARRKVLSVSEGIAGRPKWDRNLYFKKGKYLEASVGVCDILDDGLCYVSPLGKPDEYEELYYAKPYSDPDNDEGWRDGGEYMTRKEKFEHLEQFEV